MTGEVVAPRIALAVGFRVVFVNELAAFARMVRQPFSAGDSGAFATDLLDRTGVMVTPGAGYGAAGEGFFRISLTYGDDVLAEAVERIVGLRK